MTNNLLVELKLDDVPVGGLLNEAEDELPEVRRGVNLLREDGGHGLVHPEHQSNVLMNVSEQF